jgi:hypothetical protein
MNEQTEVQPRKPKVRNYSFQSSRRLPVGKMTEVNGIKVPSMPGSCYHAIICALAESRDQFVPWDRIFERTERYMRQYGGPQAWDKFRNKNQVKGFQQRIKDNTHTLTRSGRDCYGYRLHERGMCIYYFKDGAMLVTGGEIKKSNDQYEVEFPDGRALQVRYRGTTMTYKEYKKFLERGFIDPSARILDAEGIRKLRAEIAKKSTEPIPTVMEETEKRTATVSISLEDTYDQDTANRLEAMGVVVNHAESNALHCVVPADRINDLLSDKDIKDVEIVDG